MNVVINASEKIYKNADILMIGLHRNELYSITHILEIFISRCDIPIINGKVIATCIFLSSTDANIY